MERQDDQFSGGVYGSGSAVDPYSYSSGINAGAVAPVFGVGAGAPTGLYTPDFLFPEDSNISRRDFSGQLFYNGGVSYLAGIIAGGSWGAVEGIREGNAKGNASVKRRVNLLLNSCSRRGSSLGNGLGVIALMYTSFDNLLVHLREKDDILNAGVAGGVTGLLFKSTAGPRVAGAAGLVGAGVMTCVHLSSEYLSRSNR